MALMATFSFDSVVRGYHVYKAAVHGDNLLCGRETGNGHDPFAVAVVRGGVIVGHVPRRFSAVFSLFLRRGGSIMCTVTGRRMDLPQGGLELCIYNVWRIIEASEGKRSC